MTTISDKDRAEAQAMAETLAGCPLSPLGVKAISRWLAVRDRVFASHTCQPEWRPTNAEEIQPGWEIRARHSDGKEATWGTAHHRGNDGNWRAETGRLLTWDTAGWTYETTAPLPAVDHAQAIAEAARKYTPIIAEAAREYVRGLREWASGTHPYPAAADDALVAAVEAELKDKEEV